MIPIRDVVPTRLTPWATLLLISVNAGVLIYAMTRSPEDLGALLHAYGLVPIDAGLLAPLTSLFLHANAISGGANLLALWLFGSAVEDRLGPGRFLGMYLAGGLAGSLVATLTMPDLATPLVGATPAVAAIVGAYLSLFPSSRVLVLVPVPGLFDAVELPAFFFAGLWLSTELLASAGAIIDPGPAAGLVWWTTAIGLATGLAGQRVLKRPERMQPGWWSE